MTRYLLAAPDRPTYHRVVELLAGHDVPILLDVERRHLLATGDLPSAVRKHLDEQRVDVVVDAMHGPDAPGAADSPGCPPLPQALS